MILTRELRHQQKDVDETLKKKDAEIVEIEAKLRSHFFRSVFVLLGIPLLLFVGFLFTLSFEGWSSRSISAYFRCARDSASRRFTLNRSPPTHPPNIRRSVHTLCSPLPPDLYIAVGSKNTTYV